MIELRCLGSIDLGSNEHGAASRVIAQPKRYALLAYLTLASPRGFHRRDALIALFWPESDDEHARSGLRIALSFLRRELGENVIVTRGDDVAVNREAVHCDVVGFESALDTGDLEKAVSLYGGDLLPGLHISMTPEFERWIDTERERLRRRAYEAVLRLATSREAAGDRPATIHWLRFALKLAPDDEAVIQRLMQALDRAGDRAGAIRTYESFAERITKELDAEPSPETKRLIAKIRARSSEAPGLSAPSIPAPTIPPPGPKPSSERLTTRRPGAPLLVAASFALVALSSAAAVWWERQPHEKNTRTRIAVAAPQNETGRPDLDHIGGMVADKLAHDIGERALGDVVTLAALPETQLAAPSSEDVTREIAKKTSARLVLTGGYTIERDSLLLRVDVADAKADRLVAVVGPVRASVEQPSIGIDAVSSLVMSSVTRAVAPRLAGIIEQRGWSRPTPNDAFRASSEGFELFLASRSREDWEKAIGLFLYAYTRDSTEINALFEAALIEQGLEQWARADSLLTRTATIRARMTGVEPHFLDFLLARNRGDHRAAYEAARRAMEEWPAVVWEFDAGYHALAAGRPRLAATIMAGLNPDKGFLKGVWAHRGVMAEAHHVLGDHQIELELAQTQREKQPELLSTALYEARALAALGRMEDLRKLFAEAELLPPQSGLAPLLPPYRGLSAGSIIIESGLELRAHGHAAESREVLDRAVAWYRARLKSEPGSQVLQEGLGEVLYISERWNEAGRIFGVLAQQSPANVDYQGYLGLVAARLGHRADAVTVAERLAKAKDRYLFGRAALWRARIAAQLGDRNTAISLLRQARAEGSPFGIGIHRDLDLAPLRDVTAFKEFVQPDA